MLNMCFKLNFKTMGNLFKFLTYNLFLPLLIPLFILVMMKILTKVELDITLGKTILQSASVFLLVSFFTNIGFWSSNNPEVYKHKHKETYIAASLILGVVSVFLFISSTMDLDTKQVKVLMFLAFLFLILALWFYYHNPLILHSNPTVDQAKGAKKDLYLENKILNDSRGKK